MPNSKEISLAVIRRLPRYYRFLDELKQQNIYKTSSKELSEKIGLTASQIRQDLNCFGGFGQQGYGYNVDELYDEIGKILGLDQQTEAILIGAGNLGRAVTNHMDFVNRGFKLTGIFDQNPELVGQSIKGIEIMNTSQLGAFFYNNKPKVAILCIPKTVAPAISQSLIDLGVKGFWNFSHCDIVSTNSNIVVENVHLSDSLMTLSYKVSQLK